MRSIPKVTPQPCFIWFTEEKNQSNSLKTLYPGYLKTLYPGYLMFDISFGLTLTPKTDISFSFCRWETVDVDRFIICQRLTNPALFNPKVAHIQLEYVAILKSKLSPIVLENTSCLMLSKHNIMTSSVFFCKPFDHLYNLNF